jgi:hypothetical protein
MDHRVAIGSWFGNQDITQPPPTSSGDAQWGISSLPSVRQCQLEVA